MSEHEIPFHIQEEIMKSLPEKSPIRLRSVSKSWKSSIDSSHPHHHQLVLYKVSPKDVRFFSYIDDDTFPKQMFASTVPSSVKELRCFQVLGSSHGVLCVFGIHPTLTDLMAVLWNPSIHKSVAVRAPVFSSPFYGFGVCPTTCEPKLLAIQHTLNPKDRCKVAVYTLSSRKWRSPSTTIPLGCWLPQVTTKNFIYSHDETGRRKRIMSFDLTRETFEVLDLPKPLAASYKRVYYRMSQIGESLALIISTGAMHAVWVMEDDADPRSFKKLLNIITPSPSDLIHGFTINRMPIVLLTNGGHLGGIYVDDDNAFDHLYVDDDDDDGGGDDDDDDAGPPSLAVYDPNSKHTKAIHIPELTYHCYVHSYMETRLLSDCNSDSD